MVLLLVPKNFKILLIYVSLNTIGLVIFVYLFLFAAFSYIFIGNTNCFKNLWVSLSFFFMF